MHEHTAVSFDSRLITVHKHIAVSFGDGSDSLEEEENKEEEKQEVEVCKLFSELSFQPCTPNNPTKVCIIITGTPLTLSPGSDSTI